MAASNSPKRQLLGMGRVVDGIIQHRLLAPYYLLNTLLILSWFAVRLLMSTNAPEAFQSAMLRWERQGLLAVLLTVAFKLWQAPTVEAFFARTVLYVEFVVLLLAWTLDKRLFAWYFLLLGVLYLTCSQPLYSGPGKVHLLTQRSLEDIISSGGKGCAWMVFLYTHWSAPCMHRYRTFCDLAVRYSHSGLQFARVDVGRWSSVADVFRIDLGLFAQGLPTIVLIEDGREVMRLPRLNKDGATVASEMLAGEIARTFQLDMRLIKNRSRATASNPATKRTDVKTAK